MPKKYAKHGRNKRKPNGPAHPSLKRATVRNHGQEKIKLTGKRIKTRPPQKRGTTNPPLTLLQTRLLEELPTARTVGEAAVKAGYSGKNPDQTGYQALKSLRGRVPEILDRLGLDEETVIQKYLGWMSPKTIWSTTPGLR
jgi:hypothetical protein